jgi:hypothetical protein
VSSALLLYFYHSKYRCSQSTVVACSLHVQWHKNCSIWLRDEEIIWKCSMISTYLITGSFTLYIVEVEVNMYASSSFNLTWVHHLENFMKRKIVWFKFNVNNHPVLTSQGYNKWLQPLQLMSLKLFTFFMWFMKLIVTLHTFSYCSVLIRRWFSGNYYKLISL